jgi:hypothetical protein
MTNTQTKLQVTAEQKTALDLYIDSHGTKLWKFENDRDTWTNVYKSIKNLSFDEMATALYVGYEVPAPKIKVGDWVVPAKAEWLSSSRGIKCAEVETADRNTMRLKGCDGPYTYDFVRLATPNEVFWAKMGRKENEVRVGDIIVDDDGSLYRVVDSGAFIDEISIEDAVELSEAGEIYTIYPAESAVEFPKE